MSNNKEIKCYKVKSCLKTFLITLEEIEHETSFNYN